MFRRLLRHLQGELYLMLNIFLVTNNKILPEDGAVSAETCRRVLILIHVFLLYMCILLVHLIHNYYSAVSCLYMLFAFNDSSKANQRWPWPPCFNLHTGWSLFTSGLFTLLTFSDSSKVNNVNPLIANICLNAIYKDIVLQGFFYIGGHMEIPLWYCCLACKSCKNF